MSTASAGNLLESEDGPEAEVGSKGRGSVVWLSESLSLTLFPLDKEDDPSLLSRFPSISVSGSLRIFDEDPADS